MADQPPNMLGRSFAGQALSLLSEALSKGRLVPCVGAGASCDIDALGWSALVTALAKDSRFLRRQARGLPTHLDLQRVADICLASGNHDHSLRGLLYKNHRKKIIRPDWVTRSNFADTAPALLAKLCILSALLHPSQHIHCITYNFDTFLEESIAALGYRAVSMDPRGEKEFWSPSSVGQYFQKGAGRSDVSIVIFHPHGLIPRPEDRHRKLYVNRLIFTSASYEKRLLSPLDAPGVVQLMAYGKGHCFFYGFSFSDQLVRVLIRSTALKNHSYGMRHVALIGKDSDPNLEPNRWGRGLAVQLFHYNVICLQTEDFPSQKRFLRFLIYEAEKLAGKLKA